MEQCPCKRIHSAFSWRPCTLIKTLASVFLRAIPWKHSSDLICITMARRSWCATYRGLPTDASTMHIGNNIKQAQCTSHLKGPEQFLPISPGLDVIFHVAPIDAHLAVVPPSTWHRTASHGESRSDSQRQGQGKQAMSQALSQSTNARHHSPPDLSGQMPCPISF